MSKTDVANIFYSFENLVVFLREKNTIRVTKNCLQRIHICCTLRHGSPHQALVTDHVNVRVFLAAFMIAYRPTHVFESMGALEQPLFESAGPLITNFMQIAECLASNESFSDVPVNLTIAFPTMLFEYLRNFKAWKIPDETKLTCRIKHALVALYQAQENLPVDEPSDSKLSVELRTQIERLRRKLSQIAGTQELEKFDEERGRILSNGTVSGGGGISAIGGAHAALPGRLTNEQLAHELLLDPTFKLDDNGSSYAENPTYNRIRSLFHRV
jgi:hypothetical protein